MLVTLGHKGKAVGVVGVFRTGKPDRPFELRYQLVEMSQEFATPKDEEAGQPVLDLMEEYTKELKDQNYLAIPAGETRQPGGQGPDAEVRRHGSLRRLPQSRRARCGQRSKHSHAYQTLVDAKQPSNRQYDPECIVCHTVGFGYVSGFKSEKETPKLENVGCESCHGPGSLHANDSEQRGAAGGDESVEGAGERDGGAEEAPPATDRRRLPEVPRPGERRELDDGGFERNWPKIAHPTPAYEKQETAGPEN